MPDQDTEAYARARRPPRSALPLVSDLLCVAGGVGIALGFWLLPRSAAGGALVAVGIALGAAGLVLAGVSGLREARLTSTRHWSRGSRSEVQS